MKAFRGQPSIFASRQPEENRAELEVKNLSLNFGGVIALDNVDVSVHTGELLAIIGPNGAGKTSLLNCITGYYRAQKGTMAFNGQDIFHMSTHHLTGLGIGRTFQNIELFPGISVLSNMLLARHVHTKYGVALASVFSRSVKREEVHHREVLEELIDFLEMQAIRKQLVGSLPYGLRKRVELGRALATSPKLILLDELIAGLLPSETEKICEIIETLRDRGYTIFQVGHEIRPIMRTSDWIFVLDEGCKIAEGSPEEIRNNQEVQSVYLE